MSRDSGVSRPDGPSVEWSGVILTNSDGQLLLNLRGSDKLISPDRWDIIDGTIEAGETPYACLVREVMEETGEHLIAADWFRDYDLPLTDGRYGRLHVYNAALDKPASELLVGEGVEHRFFSPEKLGDLDLASGIDAVLRDYICSERYQQTSAISSR
jgi:8-oxo-dGTP diphosphatase